MNNIVKKLLQESTSEGNEYAYRILNLDKGQYYALSSICEKMIFIQQILEEDIIFGLDKAFDILDSIRIYHNTNSYEEVVKRFILECTNVDNEVFQIEGAVNWEKVAEAYKSSYEEKFIVIYDEMTGTSYLWIDEK